MYVVHRRVFRTYKRSRLCNRYVQVEDKVADNFMKRVETVILGIKCKVYNLVETICLVNSM